MGKGEVVLGEGSLSPACRGTASQFQVEPAVSPQLDARYALRCFCGQLSRNSAPSSPQRADVGPRGGCGLWGGPDSGTWGSRLGGHEPGRAATGDGNGVRVLGLRAGRTPGTLVVHC